MLTKKIKLKQEKARQHRAKKWVEKFQKLSDRLFSQDVLEVLIDRKWIFDSIRELKPEWLEQKPWVKKEAETLDLIFKDYDQISRLLKKYTK